MKSNPYEHGGELDKIALEAKMRPSELIDFSSNLNPLGPPPIVQEILREMADRIIPYPDSSSNRLRNALAEHWNLDCASFLVGNGSSELIYLIARALHPKKTVVLGPTFSEYERSARRSGSVVGHILLKRRNGFHWTPTAQDENVLSNGDLFFICNPNNPTGTLLEKGFLIDMISRYPKTVFVLDEAFMDFLTEWERYSLLRESVAYSNLIVLRSFTKFYSIAGMRLGYAVSSPGMILRLSEWKEPWTVNVIAQELGIALLRESAFAQKTRNWLPTERKHLLEGWNGLSLFEAMESQANFLLVRINSDVLDSRDIFQRLLSRNLVVRNAANFLGLDNRYFRVAIRQDKDNQKLLDAASAITSSLVAHEVVPGLR